MNEKNRVDELETLRMQLASLCADLENQQDELTIRVLSENTSNLKHEEFKLAIKWRLLARTPWIKEGEAPSSYFYSLLQEKRKNETLDFVMGEDGYIKTSKSAILNEVENFYTELYTPEICSEDSLVERKKTLGLKFRRITKEEKKFLEEIPTQLELDEMVVAFPRDKSPGIDGMTFEIVQG